MNYIGVQYNYLTVLKLDERDNNWKMRFICKCDCGNVKSYDAYSVKSGSTKSCGCKKSSFCKEANVRHGMSKTRLFKTWCSMKRRCYGKSSDTYKYYGKRGINVCEDWMIFENFMNWAFKSGYSDNLTIERLDVNGNYCPENCTWIERALQQKNKRSNVIIEYNGETKILKDWCTELNIDYKTASGRLKSGWDIERTFSNNYGIPFNRKVRKN